MHPNNAVRSLSVFIETNFIQTKYVSPWALLINDVLQCIIIHEAVLVLVRRANYEL